MNALPILHKHIYIYHLVNPWDHTIYWVIQNFSANHPGQKLLNPVLQTEYSRFWWRKSHWMWWTYFPTAATTLTCCTGISGIHYYFIYHHKISICANLPGSQITLSRDPHRSIRKTFQNYKYLPLRSLSVFYILTKTGECWISCSVLNLVPHEITSGKSQTRFLE